jgi:hypothetical protein
MNVKLNWTSSVSRAVFPLPANSFNGASGMTAMQVDCDSPLCTGGSIWQVRYCAHSCPGRVRGHVRSWRKRTCGPEEESPGLTQMYGPAARCKRLSSIRQITVLLMTPKVRPSDGWSKAPSVLATRDCLLLTGLNHYWPVDRVKLAVFADHQRSN